MRLHLELRTRQLQEDGTNAVDAERIAWRDFGNLSLLRETSREVWSWRWIESIWQDLCFGARQLARQPGFALIAILTLALGIGANCAIFSLLNAVLIRQVPVRQPQDWCGSARHGLLGARSTSRTVVSRCSPIRYFESFAARRKLSRMSRRYLVSPLEPMAGSAVLRVWRGSRSSWFPEHISPLSGWTLFKDVCLLKPTTTHPADTQSRLRAIPGGSGALA